MRSMRIVFIALLSAVAVSCPAGHAQTKTQMPAALTGQVSSAEEGPMEGVLVTAKEAG